MARGKRRASRRYRNRWLVSLIAVVAVVAAGGVAWAVLDHDLGGGTPETSVTESPTPVASAAAERRSSDPGVAAVRTCQTAYDQGARAVSAARISVGDWATHIKAMSDQQAGKISESQEKAIWTVTRLRGPGRVATFDSRYAAYQKAKRACELVDSSKLGAAQRSTVDECRASGAEIDSTLAAARQSVGEWRAHLAAMADRRAGKLDPDLAMKKWMAAYEKAPTNIGKFEQAEASLSKATTSCEST